jgi:hypothetical protein
MESRLQSAGALPRAVLEAAAARGDPGAQLLLAERLAGEGEGDAAVAWLARAVKAGHAQAFALLGAWQVLGYYVARHPAEGVQRLEIAARHGEDTAAAFLANAFACGYAGGADWARALDWLIEAARLGNARALAQVALLQSDGPASPHRAALLAAAAAGGFAAAASMAGAGPASAGAADGLPWHALRAGIDVAALMQPVPDARQAFAEPRIETFEGVASADVCRYVMGIADPHLERALVNEPHRGRGVHEMRTNSNMTIGPTDGDPLLQLLNERIARMSGTPVSHQEDTTVLRYRPGEVYDDHYDWFNPEVPEFRDEIARRGQREVTALIYLSDGYEGGETEFPELGWSHRGRAGDAIVWRNVRRDGSPDPRALHAGRPPAQGEKWVLSKWIRGRPQPILTPRRVRS